jgi:8-oxo-dGTP pyrophosphatase MutT (NUDIX family)
MRSSVTEPVINRVTTLDLTYEPWDWPFAARRRADIGAHFALKKREKPNIWNGQVLLARRPACVGGRFSASYFATDFASFLAWRDWGFVDPSVFNSFGMGALRCADGAFVMGEMGAHTSTAGRVYFPAGTPDPDDIVGDRVDIAGSVTRELEEETGLTPADYEAAAHWDCITAGSAIALIRILNVAMPADALRARIEANLARQKQPELSAIHLVRARIDISSAMPPFVAAFIERQFAS